MPDNFDQRISFNCPECEAQLKVPAKLAGVSGPCPKCHATITAPSIDPNPQESEAPDATPIPEEEMPDTSSPPSMEEMMGELETGDRENTGSNLEPHAETPGLEDTGDPKDVEDSPLPNEEKKACDEAKPRDPSIETGDLEPPQIEDVEDAGDADNSTDQENTKSGERTTFRILPPPVHDAQPSPSFPPFPSDLRSGNPSDAFPPIGSTMPIPPQLDTEDSIPPFGSTMPVSPQYEPEDSIPPFGSTMPVSPQYEPEDSIPPFGSTMPVSPQYEPEDFIPPFGSTVPVMPYPNPAENRPSIGNTLPIPLLSDSEDTAPPSNSHDDSSAEVSTEAEYQPIGPLAENEPPLTEEAGSPEPELVPSVTAEKQPGTLFDEKPEPSQPALESPLPFQPFFLPGQTPPALDPSIHAPPVYPDSTVTGSLPGIQSSAVAPIENPTPAIADSGPQLIPRTPPTAAPALDSSPLPKFVFPTAENKTREFAESNPGSPEALEPDPMVIDDDPTPNPIAASVSSPPQAMRRKSAPLRDRMENSGFAGLLKILIIFTITVIGGIALLVADFYAGGIPLLHKLPGFDPMSSLVSSILTPPNIEAIAEAPSQDNSPNPTANLDSKTDTIAQADISTSLENKNTLVDTVENPPMAATPPPLATPVISPSPTLPSDPAPNAKTMPDAAVPHPGSLAQAKNPTGPAVASNKDSDPPPLAPQKTPLATAAPEPSPSAAMPTPKPTTSNEPSVLPGNAMTSPSAIFPTDESQADTAKMASYLPDPSPGNPDPSIPALPAKAEPTKAEPTKAEPTEIKPTSPAPAMIRAVPIELPDAVPTDKNKQPISPTAKSPPSVVVDLTKSTPAPNLTEPVNPPGNKDTDKTLSEPRHVAEAFLRAPSWKERLPYVYNGEALKEIIDGYYQQDPQEAITDYTLEFINMERSRSDNTLFYVFLLTTKKLPDGFPVILRTEKGALKVDWEIFAEFNDQHFKYFVKSEDRGQHPLRMMLKRASYWGPDKDKFADLNDYLCFGVSAPPFLDKGEFAFVKIGTPLAKQLEASLPWGQHPLSGIVELEKVKFAHGQDHLVIKSIVTDGWFSPPAAP